jgi:hypothetical protein
LAFECPFPGFAAFEEKSEAFMYAPLFSMLEFDFMDPITN